MDQYIKDLIAKLNAPIKQLWDNNKIFLIFFGLLILVIKFRNVLFDLVVKGANRELEKATKQDQVLKQEEDDANKKANQLINEANSLDNNKPSVDENWYKNDKK